MKYRIRKVQYKGKTVYEPQVCKQVKTKIPTGEWELVDTWDDLIINKGLVHQEIYLNLLPTTVEEAEKIIETYHEKLYQSKEPIIKTIKEYEL